MHAPCDTEGRRGVDRDGAAIRDQVHDQNVPVDGPLLNPDDAAADVGRGELGKVDTDLRRGDSDWQVLIKVRRGEGSTGREELTGKTTDNSPDNKVSNILSAALKGCSNDPDDTGNLEDSATAHVITQPASPEWADEAAGAHGCSDAALRIRVRVSEVFEILVAADPGRHAGNVKPKQSPADRAARKKVSNY